MEIKPGDLTLDWPPLWTAGAVVLSWAAGWVMPWPILGAAGVVLGAVLALTGIGLMVAAALEMRRARTTVIPRRTPSAQVTALAWVTAAIITKAALRDMTIVFIVFLRWYPLAREATTDQVRKRRPSGFGGMQLERRSQHCNPAATFRTSFACGP